MDPTPLKLPIHDHPIFLSSRYGSGCNGCHVHNFMYGNYYCNEPECFARFHKECGEAPLEINHRSHPQHPLLFTNDWGENTCNLCGQRLFRPYYSCPTCEFRVDLTCGMKPSSPTIEHPMCHEHPLVFSKIRQEKVPCQFCKETIRGPSYACLGCYVYFHMDCVHLTKEVNHPCHSSHPLKLVASNTLRDDAERSCLICEQPKDVVYHCYVCNFTSCVCCTKNSPPLVIEHTKTHEHPLTRISKRNSYACDVCGEEVNMGLYICVQCDFVIHLKCIGLPRVININRHDHLVSFTHHRGTGYSKCEVCRQYISRYKGAYSCSICPNYAVHSMCALRGWDGKDYEGSPDIIEDIAPYKVVDDNLIRHFSHEKHLLMLHKGVIIHDEDLRCEACIYPIGFGPIYICQECLFFLHEKCANLSMKKKMVFDVIPYTLKAVNTIDYCNICGLFCDGFKYKAPGRLSIDVRCGSLSEPFVHDGHIHPLYLKIIVGVCGGCSNKVDGYTLCCDNCDFRLCVYCANLPEKIRHKNDAHPLNLCFGEKAGNKYWCDICEEELYTNKWFYTCSGCGVTLHARCVIGGDFSSIITGNINKLEVVLNNHSSRPLCSQCHTRCKLPVIIKDPYKQYICSNLCLFRYIGLAELLPLAKPSLVFDDTVTSVIRMRSA